MGLTGQEAGKRQTLAAVNLGWYAPLLILTEYQTVCLCLMREIQAIVYVHVKLSII